MHTYVDHHALRENYYSSVAVYFSMFFMIIIRFFVFFKSNSHVYSWTKAAKVYCLFTGRPMSVKRLRFSVMGLFNTFQNRTVFFFH